MTSMSGSDRMQGPPEQNGGKDWGGDPRLPHPSAEERLPKGKCSTKVTSYVGGALRCPKNREKKST